MAANSLFYQIPCSCGDGFFLMLSQPLREQADDVTQPKLELTSGSRACNASSSMSLNTLQTPITFEPNDAEMQEKEISAREKEEARGWTLDAAARGVAVMGCSVFVSTALLHKADQAAGCDVGDADCGGRVYGMRPSSLLTNIVTVVGLISALVMPILGSMIDHTNHRKTVGTVSAGILTLLILLQVVFLEIPVLWFGAAITQVFVAFFYSIHLTAVYAYLPELTEDSEKLTIYAAQFTATQYAASVVFLVAMVYIISIIGIEEDDEMTSTMVSQVFVVVICSICFSYAWLFLFKNRQARHPIEPDQSIYSAGLRKIYKTGKAILNHHKAIKWFLVATAFTEAAATAFSSIAITYMTNQLQFSSTENGVAILLLLVFAVPGTKIGAWVTKNINPIRSLQLCLLVWILNTAAASYILRGPGQQMTVMVFSVVWGISVGWVYPVEKALYCSIINKGKEAELMGIYICSCQILAWLPPLVFTLMTEFQISMRMGLLSLNLYFLISFLLLFLVGDHEEAVQHARDIDEGKILFTGSLIQELVDSTQQKSSGDFSIDYREL